MKNIASEEKRSRSEKKNRAPRHRTWQSLREKGASAELLLQAHATPRFPRHDKGIEIGRMLNGYERETGRGRRKPEQPARLLAHLVTKIRRCRKSCRSEIQESIKAGRLLVGEAAAAVHKPCAPSKEEAKTTKNF